MSDANFIIQEEAVARAFDKQADSFDLMYGQNTIIDYKRQRVREHVLKYLPAKSSILEINAGTGEDAIFFASQGHRVHASDISSKMQEILSKKVGEKGLSRVVSAEQCSFTALENLQKTGPYDLIFSNFAGLNCTNNLSKVLDAFSPLLKPGGFVTLVMLPKFCLWEFLLLFKGRFRTAFRRFHGKKGAAAKIDDQHFRCWYYNPSFIRTYLGHSFEVIGQEGLCTIVPPSYIEGFAEKYPKLYGRAVKLEERFKSKWPWRSIGDYYILSLRKRG